MGLMAPLIPAWLNNTSILPHLATVELEIALGIFRVRDVRLYEREGIGTRPQASGGLGEVFFVTAYEHDPCPFSQEDGGTCQAYAARPTGDYAHLAVHHPHLVSLLAHFRLMCPFLLVDYAQNGRMMSSEILPG